MPPDTSPPVGNSYFWESQRINHISYSRRWRAFSWRGTGSEWGRFHFRVVVLHMLQGCQHTVCEQGWAQGTGHGRVGSAPSHFPSRPDLRRWVLKGDLPAWPQPLDGCSVAGRW